MAGANSQGLFISHTHTDQAIAHSIRDAVQSIFSGAVTVNYSTNKELEGGIKPGEDWFRWIGQQVRGSKVALILLTTSSIQKPWLLWEAGAVAGAALATDGEGHRKLRPISYGLRGADIPTPFGREQVTDGLSEGEVERLFSDLVEQYSSVLTPGAMVKAGQQLGPASRRYLSQASEACRLAPLLPTEPVVQEWLERITALEAQRRASEVDELHNWLNVAFGRSEADEQRPLDIRIHRRLGELYAQAGQSNRAASEFELARELAPRDIYVLRRLGKAYLDQGSDKWEEAGKVIKIIEELDASAFERNAENAAFKARWYSERAAYAEAVAVLKAAYLHNPRSYYLADLLGQAQLQVGNVEEARRIYAQVLSLVEAMTQRNVWVLATGLTASVVTADKQRQSRFLAELAKLSITNEQAESIRRGLHKVVDPLGATAAAILLSFDQAIGLHRDVA